MMTRKMLAVAIAVAVAGCVCACSKKGDEAPKMIKEFSADIVTTTPSGKISGKLYVSEDRSRVEMPQTTMITRLDKGVVWVLMPAKMYIEQPVTPDSAAAFMDELPEGATREYIAEESIDGRGVKKYKVAVTQDGTSGTFYQWIDEETGIPLKVAGEGDAWVFEYRNLKPGKQQASLFEIPEDYRKMEIPAAQ